MSLPCLQDPKRIRGNFLANDALVGKDFWTPWSVGGVMGIVLDVCEKFAYSSLPNLGRRNRQIGSEKPLGFFQGLLDVMHNQLRKGFLARAVSCNDSTVSVDQKFLEVPLDFTLKWRVLGEIPI